MEDLLSVELEAHNDAKNHHSRYSMTVGQDLFGLWTLTVNFGRVSGKGRTQRFAADEQNEILLTIAKRFKRRRDARNRIGCGYQIVNLVFDQRLHALPMSSAKLRPDQFRGDGLREPSLSAEDFSKILFENLGKRKRSCD